MTVGTMINGSVISKARIRPGDIVDHYFTSRARASPTRYKDPVIKMTSEGAALFVMSNARLRLPATRIEGWSEASASASGRKARAKAGAVTTTSDARGNRISV